MDLHVLFEIGCISDDFQAHHALMKIVSFQGLALISVMGLHVLVQINFTTKRATAIIALELRWIGIVHQHMFSKRRRFGEGFGTNVTFVALLPCVYFQMTVQTGRLRKSLLTYFTTVWCGTAVRYQMRFQIAPFSER